MGSVRILLTTAVVAALSGSGLSACAHTGSAAGDVAIAPDVAANTTVLHVANRYKSDMRVYSVIRGKQRYLGAVGAQSTRDFVMNPDLVGESGVSFSARESNADESTSISRGPYLIDRGRVIEFAITAREVEDLKHTLAPPDRTVGARY
jgi:hypothetical protein